MNRYEDLKVWQRSVLLATEVYQATKDFPEEEKFGLTSQIKRSVVSIASNIAEGAGRSYSKEFGQFLSIANGSCCELNTQLTIAKNLSFLVESSFSLLREKITEIQKMIYKLRQSLKANY
ncbi:MAG: four helix bundle protein [Bacteroidota bacterium]